MLHPTPVYDPDEEHAKNINSIDLAIKKVKDGGLVIIFPGRRSRDGHWFSGVGHLIKGLGRNSNAHIIKVYVEGTSNADYLRMLPLLGKFLPTITIHYSLSTPVSSFFEDDGKKIAAKLETKYNQWVEKISR
jgi:hypothetical protein